eukprot:244258-Amphidinium_carterae.1
MSRDSICSCPCARDCSKWPLEGASLGRHGPSAGPEAMVTRMRRPRHVASRCSRNQAIQDSLLTEELTVDQ